MSEIFTESNYDKLVVLAEKAKAEYDAGKMTALEYINSIKLIRRLGAEGRVDEFMSLHGYTV